MTVITTIEDLRVLAKKRMPRMFYDYADSGSWTESTYRANASDFQTIKLRQRVAVNMENRSTATKMVGQEAKMPVCIAPVGLTEDGLGAALERLAARFGAETSVPVEVVLPPSIPEVGREREVILLRAAQEALTNVRRHAEARAVRLALTVTDAGAVELEVSDDGRGIDPGVAEGFGLRGMRDRVTSGGGDLQVATRHEGGTRVVVVLPSGAVGG